MSIDVEGISARPGIYRFVCTLSDRAYIGQAVNLRRRLSRQIRELQIGQHHNRHFQSAYNLYGSSAFHVEVIEHCDVTELDAREQFWLDFVGLENLFNKCPVARSAKGMKMPAEAIQKIRAWNLGRKRSPSAVANMRALRKPVSEQTRRKISQAQIGRKASDETKARMRAAAINKPKSTEHRASLSKSRRGIVFSQSHRQNLSMASKRAWARRKGLGHE